MEAVNIPPYASQPAENENPPQPQKDGLNEYHSYKCAFCGEQSDVFVDATATWLFEPMGTQRQLLAEECHACCGRNLLTLIVDRDGNVSVLAERETETD